MIRLAVCDDEQVFTEKIGEIVREHGAKRDTVEEICCYTDSRMLLYDIEEGRGFDLFLLDIEMPGLSGMELAEKIRSYLPQAMILFITSYTKYAVKAFELSVFRYIPKSELEVCLPLALDDACALLEMKDKDSYLIESPRKVTKVWMEDILYIEKEQKYSVLVLKEDRISVRKSLVQVLKELDHPEFLMIERGYIVNLYHVMKLEHNQIFLRGGEILPVGGSHIKVVRQAVADFWRKRL